MATEMNDLARAHMARNRAEIANARGWSEAEVTRRVNLIKEACGCADELDAVIVLWNATAKGGWDMLDPDLLSEPVVGVVTPPPPSPKPTDRRLTPREYCERFYAWLPLIKAVIPTLDTDGVVVAVKKSCLLDRMIYGGEMPSQTPCPVHKGVWSGCHSSWPGWGYKDLKTGEWTPMPAAEMEQSWFDAGCRCFQHKGCSCTTGWNPDEHCGCLAVQKETTGGDQ